MFTGISAFPLTPVHEGRVHVPSLERIFEKSREAKVDSVGVLGSTGCYPYFDVDERALVAKKSVEFAGDLPVIVGVGDLRTVNVLKHIDNAQEAGAAGVILAPVAFHSLTNREVMHLYATATDHTEIPLVVYDNPFTAHFDFSLDLYQEIAQLPHVVSFKIPSTKFTADYEVAKEKIAELRSVLPDHVTIGVSGDPAAAAGLSAGGQVWYSGLTGSIPFSMSKIARPALAGNVEEALAEKERLAPLWDACKKFTALRVGATIAEYRGTVVANSLPRPVLALPEEDKREVQRIADELDLH